MCVSCWDINLPPLPLPQIYPDCSEHHGGHPFSSICWAYSNFPRGEKDKESCKLFYLLFPYPCATLATSSDLPHSWSCEFVVTVSSLPQSWKYNLFITVYNVFEIEGKRVSVFIIYKPTLQETQVHSVCLLSCAILPERFFDREKYFLVRCNFHLQKTFFISSSSNLGLHPWGLMHFAQKFVEVKLGLGMKGAELFNECGAAA